MVFCARLISKSLYPNVLVEDAIRLLKQFMFKFQNSVPTAHLVLELLDTVLKRSLIQSSGEYFQKFFCMSMGTNDAHLLANLRFIDHGFGIFVESKNELILWVKELHKF